MRLRAKFSGFIARARHEPGRGVQLAGAGAAVAVLAFGLGWMLWPMLKDFSTYGFHDWDVESAYRFITVVSLREYGEFPWWHPWLCGGVPAWGHVESATNLVSPYLPVYLLFDVPTAIRLEVLGGAALGLAGTYLLAGRFTQSIALRVFLCALFVFNGRWSLQAAVGHTWHLQYALLPWTLFFFDRAERGSLYNAGAAGAMMALMCFWGGIYPLPQTALLLTVYALLHAFFGRSLRPLLSLLVTGVTALGLAAPKLFAIVDHMGQIPRLIESKEVIGLKELVVMLTEPNQRYGAFPIRVPAYNWHEWGIYIGSAGLACLVIGFLFARGPREHALRLVGFLCLLLGFGAFHPRAPWTLLHELPVFSSQHVPSRFHYPMLLFLGLAFVAWAGALLDPLIRRCRSVELLALLPVAVFTLDLARVSQRPFAQAFWMEKPHHIPRVELFEHRTHAPVHYRRRDWAEPMLLSMLANTGVIECYGIDPSFEPGAVGADQPAYRGRVYVTQGEGSARLVDWSPNRARVDVSWATRDALLVYNMNYDPSWQVNGEPALDYLGKVAARLEPGVESVEFRYFPRTLVWSMPIFFAACAALAAAWIFRPSRTSPNAQSPRKAAPPEA